MRLPVEDEQEHLIGRLVNTGATLHEVLMVLHGYRSHTVREIYNSLKRSYRRWARVVDPKEVGQRVEWVQSQWTEAEWSQRWVGRFATGRESDLQQAASKMLW